MKKTRKTSIISTVHPPPLVMTKGKKTMVHSPDWIDRIEPRNMRKNPKKIRAVPSVIRSIRCPKGLPKSCSLLEHWRQRPSLG